MDERERGTGAASDRRIGPAGAAIGLSPRMLRYLEDQGVIVPEHGPGPRGHRHFPPPEIALGRAAAVAMETGHPTATLRALRGLAERRVADARAAGDPLAWYELLAIERAVAAARRSDEPSPPPHPGRDDPGPRPDAPLARPPGAGRPPRR